MARIVKEEVFVTVSRLVRDDDKKVAHVVTDEHRQILDEALKEIWELPPGTVVEVLKIDNPD